MASRGWAVVCFLSFVLIHPFVHLVDASAADNTATTNAPSAHLDCVKTLRQIVAAKPGVVAAMEKNDLAELTRLHRQIEEQTRQMRSEMETAFLVGAWKSGEMKRESGDVMGRLEGVRGLNFISLAMLTGYEHPTKKTPASVADATTRMFSQTDILLARIDAMNGKAH